MTGHTAGHSLHFSLHGDDQLQTGLAPPNIPPDLSEDLQTGPGVLSSRLAPCLSRDWLTVTDITRKDRRMMVVLVVFITGERLGLGLMADLHLRQIWSAESCSL